MKKYFTKEKILNKKEDIKRRVNEITDKRRN